jgi:hypothetical protein
MTEATAWDAAADTLAISADTMAHDFVAAILQELRQMPDHWSRMNAEKQQQIIERLKEKIRAGTAKAVQIMLRSEFPAVQADLESINWKNGLTGTLKIPKDAVYRHQVCDAVGSAVLIVVADPERWFNRIDEIKAKEDQLQLFSGDYDPAIDQPGYRRDQDRVAPAGPTWDQLKKQLNVGGEAGDQPPPAPAEGDAAAEPPKEGEEQPLVFGSAATEDEERRAAFGMLQEQLAALGVGVSLGMVQSWTPDEIRVVREWADAYAASPAGECPIARPHWLPIPDLNAGEAE